MLFGLMLAKHKGQSIAIITSLGDNGVFKLAVKGALQPIADQHNVKLTTVNKLSQQAIPEGVEEIPIFHWKIEGLDALKGKFEVIWEMNGHYYPEDQIKTAVREKFSLDCSQVKPTFSYLPTTDFFNQQNYQTKSLVWKHPLAKMEVDHNQVADMIQTEGRFLREDEIHKTIYRTHNVIFQPYPIRVYQSWKMMLEQEFEDYISPLELLKPKEKKIHDWIQDNYNGIEFTVNEISNDMDLDPDNMRNKYLKRLVELYLLDKRKVNRKNLYRLIV